MVRPYITPPDTRIYAIGDLHGHRDALMSMMAQIEMDVQNHPIERVMVIFLGDYIDRGPDSSGVLDQLVHLQNGNLPYEFVFLKGNHEAGMLGFIADPVEREDWLHWGGRETLGSYGLTCAEFAQSEEELIDLGAHFNRVLPSPHRDFLKELKLYHLEGDYLFVHAGIRPGIALEAQVERDLWMIREPFLSSVDKHPWRVVHGHTICRDAEILPNRINVDTGLYKNGVLSCAVLQNKSAHIMQVRP